MSRQIKESKSVRMYIPPIELNFTEHGQIRNMLDRRMKFPDFFQSEYLAIL
jgi:hypothetical protein